MANKYTAPEIYKLYRMFKDEKWRGFIRFFFGTSHEPSSARKAFERIRKNLVHMMYIVPIDCPIDKKKLDSSKRDTVTFVGIRWLMFRESLENMPLWINYRGYNVVARWRLELGR